MKKEGGGGREREGGRQERIRVKRGGDKVKTRRGEPGS